MRLVVGRPRGQAVLSRLLAAAAGLALLLGAPVRASKTDAGEPPEIHATLREFFLTGDYVVKSAEKGTQAPALYFSTRATAYLLRGSALDASVLLRTGPTQAVESFPDEAVVPRVDGGVDVRADVETKALGRFTMEGSDIVVRVPGLSVRLVPAPPLVGWQKASHLVAHTPKYGRDAKSYRPDSPCLEALKGSRGDIRIFVYFGSWCSTCSQLLGRILRLEQELARDPTIKVTFDYYGLPGPPRTWDDPEAVARDVDRLPTGLVYVDAHYRGRIVGNQWSQPESALKALLGDR